MLLPAKIVPHFLSAQTTHARLAPPKEVVSPAHAAKDIITEARITARHVPQLMSAQTQHARLAPPKEAVSPDHATPDTTSADQTASPALPERIPKAGRLPPVPAAALFMPEAAILNAPVVQPRGHAPGLLIVQAAQRDIRRILL